MQPNVKRVQTERAKAAEIQRATCGLIDLVAKLVAREIVKGASKHTSAIKPRMTEQPGDRTIGGIINE